MTMVSAVHYRLQQSYNCYGYGLPKMDITWEHPNEDKYLLDSKYQNWLRSSW